MFFKYRSECYQLIFLYIYLVFGNKIFITREFIFVKQTRYAVLNKSQMDLKLMIILREKQNLHFAN